MFHQLLHAALFASLPLFAAVSGSNIAAAPLDDLDLPLSLGQDDLTVEDAGDDTEAASNTNSPTPDSISNPIGPNATAIEAARAAFSRKEVAKSLELLTIAKAQDPALPPPRLILADMYFQAGARGAGRAVLEQVAVEDPSHPELWRMLGSVALSDRRWTEAILHFNRGLELPPPAVWKPRQQQTFVFSCKRGLAAALEQRNDLHGAARVLGEMAEMAPAVGAGSGEHERESLRTIQDRLPSR